MHVVIFGLTISSSWGNGHATLWRSLVNAMLERGHTVSFYERDVPYYAADRDLFDLPPGGRLVLYARLEDVAASAQRDLDDADLALTTSFCPDGPAAAEMILNSRAGIKAFYDLDTPVTLAGLTRFGLQQGARPAYLPAAGLRDFDLVLSYTGGRALTELETRLGARRAVPLYGSVDPARHRPVTPVAAYRCELSYLGTYSEDRQAGVERLLLQPAEALADRYFLIGGAQYPESFPWRANLGFVAHVPPEQHPAFFCSGRATLNVTRAAMASYGYCPSGRLFEAAACGVPLITDRWEGLDDFFKPGEQMLAVSTSDDVVAALSLSDAELRRIAGEARERTLEEHTGAHRVQQLEAICNSIGSREGTQPEAGRIHAVQA